MANGRCRMHGGGNKGAHKPHAAKGAANPAYTHGIYTKFFRDEEKELIDAGAIALGRVDDELILVRIRLKRAVEAKERWEAECAGLIDGADESTSLVLVETEEGEKPFGKDADLMEYSGKKRRLTDFDKIIDACLARIESLEKTRKELAKETPPDPEGGEGGTGTHHVTFTGGLTGTDEELPSPFEEP